MEKLKKEAIEFLDKEEPIELLCENEKSGEKRKIVIFHGNDLSTYVWHLERWNQGTCSVTIDYKATVHKDIFSVIDGLFALFQIKSVRSLF